LAETMRSMDAMPRRPPAAHADTALTRIAGPAVPARGKSDSPCPCRVQGQDAEDLRRPLPRDPQRARACSGRG
jgi:hypothetical protein